MVDENDSQKYESIYWVVSMIPEGYVTSYGRIANMIPGVSARQVARAMSQIPTGSLLPWHRVVNSSLKISNFQGSDRQRAQLIEEGVSVTEGLKINPSHLWKPT